jgi:SAM-dependent methyltransferase
MDVVDGKEPAGLSTYSGLHWKDRPDEIKEKINQIFTPLSQQTDSNWTVNGQKAYQPLDVCEIKLAHHLMISQPEQKLFTFLDLGSGQFQWVNYLTQRINEFNDIPDGVKVRIIGVRAEQYSGEERSAIGRCDVFKVGQVKIENMEEEEEKFQKKYGIALKDNVDVTVTSWCFRHFVDPVGALAQVAKFVRPKTGLFFGDGFAFGFKGQLDYDISQEICQHMSELLLDMNLPFLIQRNSSSGAVNKYVFRRDADDSLKLPLKYSGLRPYNNEGMVAGVVTLFEHVGPRPQWTEPDPHSFDETWAMEGNWYGSQELYDFFNKNDLFTFELYPMGDLVKKRRKFIPFGGRHSDYSPLQQKD